MVSNVTTVQETRTMYNLEVQEAHTFFVGTQGWLVHNGNGSSNPTMFRIEGDINQRLLLDAHGNITFKPGKKGMLYVAFNDDHALYFLEKRAGQGMEGARAVGVQVDPGFLEKLRADAVPQQLSKRFPGRPQIVDATIGKDLYGIPAEYFEELQRAMVPGTGFTVCP